MKTPKTLSSLSNSARWDREKRRKN